MARYSDSPIVFWPRCVSHCSRNFQEGGLRFRNNQSGRKEEKREDEHLLIYHEEPPPSVTFKQSHPSRPVKLHDTNKDSKGEEEDTSRRLWQQGRAREESETVRQN